MRAFLMEHDVPIEQFRLLLPAASRCIYNGKSYQASFELPHIDLTLFSVPTEQVLIGIEDVGKQEVLSA